MKDKNRSKNNKNGSLGLKIKEKINTKCFKLPFAYLGDMLNQYENLLSLEHDVIETNCRKGESIRLSSTIN